MKNSWLGLVLVLGLWAAPAVSALELSGLWKGNNGQAYTIRQNGKQVTIQGQSGTIRAQLVEDDSLVKSDKATFQWVDDDTLVLKVGAMGDLTRLRRQ
ncbi:hypothetical protein [Anthocerotibacter panamensis]|uniref:hypothetical protein n=1 Tax=Anthocerotibacter panamensis TaxID=2857077 RepID=UPI001C40255C|nr:hypothetical protein [Anthocerotibacter panamensis]